jgi:hypothetical protein
MNKKRWLVIPFILLFTLGCGLISQAQDIKNAASTAMPAISTELTALATQMPALLTSAPTAQGMIETLAASNPCTGTTTPGGLGISMDTARTVLQMSKQFAFTDGTVKDQPAVIVALTPDGASSFPAIAQGFSAQFIGNACNLSRVTFTIPRTDQQDTVDQGISIINIVLTGTLPLDVTFAFAPWLNQNYSSVPVSGQQQTTIKTFQFTLQRDQTSMVLDIVPAP